MRAHDRKHGSHQHRFYWPLWRSFPAFACANFYMNILEEISSLAPNFPVSPFLSLVIVKICHSPMHWKAFNSEHAPQPVMHVTVTDRGRLRSYPLAEHSPPTCQKEAPSDRTQEEKREFCKMLGASGLQHRCSASLQTPVCRPCLHRPAVFGRALPLLASRPQVSFLRFLASHAYSAWPADLAATEDRASLLLC